MVVVLLYFAGAVFNPVFVSGPEGMRFNPAQLGFPERPGFCCKVLDIGFRLDNNSFTFSQYNRYTGAYLDERAKSDILGSIPRSGVNLRLVGNGRAAEFGYENLAVTFQTVGQAEANLPREVLELLLSGNELDRQYSAKGARAEAEVLFRAGAGAGTAIGRNLTLGLAVHYLRGLFRAELTDCEAQFLTTRERLAADGRVGYRTATGGNGVSFDVGATWVSDGQEPAAGRWWQGWHFSLACLDFSPGILWTEGVEEGELWFQLDSANAYEIARGGRFSHEAHLSAGEPFVTSIPIRTNLGIGRWFCDWLNGAFLVQPAWNGRPFALREFCCALVGEVWPCEWLPLGCAVAYQQTRGFLLGGDVALVRDRLAFTFGVRDIAGLFMAAKGAELRLSIGYATFNKVRKKELPFLMHASGR